MQDEVAVCNLASLALPKFVNKQAKTFDFQKVKHIPSSAAFLKCPFSTPSCST